MAENVTRMESPTLGCLTLSLSLSLSLSPSSHSYLVLLSSSFAAMWFFLLYPSETVVTDDSSNLGKREGECLSRLFGWQQQKTESNRP
jgi:hypothetical protein